MILILAPFPFRCNHFKYQRVVSTLFSMSTTLCMKLFITSEVLFRLTTNVFRYQSSFASSFLLSPRILSSSRCFLSSFIFIINESINHVGAKVTVPLVLKLLELELSTVLDLKLAPREDLLLGVQRLAENVEFLKLLIDRIDHRSLGHVVFPREVELVVRLFLIEARILGGGVVGDVLVGDSTSFYLDPAIPVFAGGDIGEGVRVIEGHEGRKDLCLVLLLVETVLAGVQVAHTDLLVKRSLLVASLWLHIHDFSALVMAIIVAVDLVERWCDL